MMTNKKDEQKQRVIIGISGKIGSGKDHFSDIAVNEFNFTKIPFAKALKNEVIDFLIEFNIPYKLSNIWGTQSEKEEELSFPSYFDFSSMVEKYMFLEKKCRGLTFRLLMQLWGTEYRRLQDKDYWVKKTLLSISKYDKVVISDMRFMNEYMAIKLIGGIVIRINRTESFKDPSIIRHLSETDLDNILNWDYKVDNYNSLSSYDNICRLTLEEIVKKNE